MTADALSVGIPAQEATSYPIVFASLSSLSELLPLGTSHLFVLTDEKVKAKALKEGVKDATIITIPSGEKEKKFSTLGTIWEELQKGKADRHSVLVNIGGGVVTDIGGFAASTYMRGIKFIQVPTTLLAQVDASIGGKTGIDHHDIKNLVGTFAYPHAVLIDISLLNSLPMREFNAGLAEVIKHGLIKDRTYFDEAVTFCKRRQMKNLEPLIKGSLKIKKEIVERDPTEKGERKLLNFGHTAGHALESLSLQSPHPLLHGEAIGLGMIVEAALSVEKKLLAPDQLPLVISAVMSAGLPTHFVVDLAATKELLLTDKKNRKGKILWTLLKNIGEGVWDIEASESGVESAFKAIAVYE